MPSLTPTLPSTAPPAAVPAPAAPPPDRLLGLLLGTALGDALGLPAEGMSAAQIRRRWGAVRRFHLLGPWGVVSDDTEQSALLVQAVARVGAEPAALARAFRRSLVGWIWRLPFGVGLGTLRAGLKLTFGASQGVRSAGNGAAMRAAPLGVLIDDPDARVAAGRAVARLTHTDDRAVEGALMMAELAAAAHTPPADAIAAASGVLTHPDLRAAVDQARALASATPDEAVAALGHTGYIVHTLGLVVWAWRRWADAAPLDALSQVIALGGDTDTIAAMFGALYGARHGAAALPAEVIARLAPGPFGLKHLRALAAAAEARERPPRWAWPVALLRNLALYPVILGHGLRRLIP